METGIKNTEEKDQTLKVMELVHKLMKEGFYGKLKLSFQDGVVTHVSCDSRSPFNKIKKVVCIK